MDDIELLRAAVARDGHKCVVCGAPCRDHEARRRIDADPALGDRPENWVPMCGACQGFLAGKLPPPARYVAHLYSDSRFRWTLRRWWQGGLFALSLSVYAALCGIAGYTLWNSIDSPWEALGTALLITFLLAMAYAYAVAEPRASTASQRIHHSFDPQVVRVREDR